MPLEWFVSPWLARVGREAELVMVAKRALPQPPAQSHKLRGAALVK